jgi:predicted HTH domain antitoxin
MSILKLELADEVADLLMQSDLPPEDAAREVIVMDAYRRGAISEGRACELLEMPRLQFIERAQEHGIQHFRFTEEEWKDEVAESRRI